MNGRDVRIGASLLVGNMDSMVRFYRDILGFHTEWNGGDFAEFETASGALSMFMYSRKEFVKAYERLSKLGLQFPTGEPITYPFGI